MSRYDDIIEVRKHDSEAKTFDEILKFNPYHDAKGRFASSNGATSMTVFTNSPQGQKAIANIKAKELAAMGGGGGSSGNMKPKDAATNKPPKGTKTQTEHPEGERQGAAGVKETLGGNVSDKEAKKMAEAVGDFSVDGYTDIRKAGFEGAPPASQKHKEQADTIDEFVDRAPKFEGEVYRGIGVSAEKANKIVAQARKGEMINQMGAASFSTDLGTAEDFSAEGEGGTPILFKSSGVQNGTSIRNISDFPSEDEVIMSSKARWRPVKVEEGMVGDEPGYIITCEPYWGDTADYVAKPLES